MSSRRTSHSTDEAQLAVDGVGGRAGSDLSVGTGTGTSTASSKPASAPAEPATTSSSTSAMSCHFRYTGCYLLLVISDGCDMLRQEDLCHRLKLLQTSTSAEGNGGNGSAVPPELVNSLDSLDSDWNRKFLEHTTQQIAKGLLSWDTSQTKCDLKPLEAFLEKALLNRAAESNGDTNNDELLLQYSQDSLAVEVLLNPSLLTLTQCLRNVLRSPTGAVHVVYAGATFEETGSWILADGSFSAYNFYELVENEESSSVIGGGATSSSSSESCKGHTSIAEHLSCHDVVVRFHTERPGEWSVLANIFANHHFEVVHTSMTSSLIAADLAAQKRDCPKRRRHLFHFDLNASDTADGVQGSAALVDFVQEKLSHHFQKEKTITRARFGSSADSNLAESVGYIRLDRPTVYVFPGGQGDCAIFGLDSGFTMLIDGGYMPGHKSFWNFVRHLQRLDSVVVTHLGEDNLLGLNTLLENKLLREKWASFRAPQIGYLFCNDQFAQPPQQSDDTDKSTNGNTSGDCSKSLLDVATLSLGGLNGQFFSSLNQLNIEPLACIRNLDSLNSGPVQKGAKLPDKPVPVTLYHKVGHGTLYMYVLSPTLESITKPTAPAANASTTAAGVTATIPEADQQSICSLLVWRPHDLGEKIARILIPGNCTQADILEGFEALLAMAKASKRASRYAPKPKEEATADAIELDILLSQPYPCTGEAIEVALKTREDAKSVKFRSSGHGMSSLHGYRRSASVAPKVISQRQQQQQNSKEPASKRQRSTTPSRFSRFRSVSPTTRVRKLPDKPAVTTPTGPPPPMPPTQARVAAKLAPVARPAVRASSPRSPEIDESVVKKESRQQKSRPVSAASSNDRLPVKSTAAAPITQQPKPLTKPSAPSVSKPKSKPPAPTVQKDSVKPTTVANVLQSSTGKKFMSAKDFRKNVEANNKPTAAPTTPAQKETGKKTDSAQPRPVPRKVKKPESAQEEKIVPMAAVAPVDAAQAVSETQPAEILTPTESHELGSKAVADLKAYDADSEDVSVRSTTDEEVLRITQLIAERELAERAERAATAVIGGVRKSPPVTASEGDEVEESHSNHTVTDDQKLDSKQTASAYAIDTDDEAGAIQDDDDEPPAEVSHGYYTDDHERLESLQSIDLENELKPTRIAPPTPSNTPARPDEEAENVTETAEEQQHTPTQSDEQQQIDNGLHVRFGDAEFVELPPYSPAIHPADSSLDYSEDLESSLEPGQKDLMQQSVYQGDTSSDKGAEKPIPSEPHMTATKADQTQMEKPQTSQSAELASNEEPEIQSKIAKQSELEITPPVQEPKDDNNEAFQSKPSSTQSELSKPSDKNAQNTIVEPDSLPYSVLSDATDFDKKTDDKVTAEMPQIQVEKPVNKAEINIAASQLKDHDILDRTESAPMGSTSKSEKDLVHMTEPQGGSLSKASSLESELANRKDSSSDSSAENRLKSYPSVEDLTKMDDMRQSNESVVSEQQDGDLPSYEEITLKEMPKSESKSKGRVDVETVPEVKVEKAPSEEKHEKIDTVESDGNTAPVPAEQKDKMAQQAEDDVVFQVSLDPDLREAISTQQSLEEATSTQGPTKAEQNVDSDQKSTSSSESFQMIQPDSDAKSDDDEAETGAADVWPREVSVEEYDDQQQKQDQTDKEIESTFEIIEDDGLTAKDSEDSINRANDQSPMVEDPPSSPKPPRPESNVQITDITTPAVSRKVSIATAAEEEEFERKFIQSELHVTPGTESVLSEGQEGKEDEHQSRVKRSEPHHRVKSDREFEEAFLRSGDLTQSMEPQIQSTRIEEEAEESDEHLESMNEEYKEPSKLETYFTSDLVKPLEASKPQEEIFSEKFDESQSQVQQKPFEETVTSAHSSELESQPAKDSKFEDQSEERRQKSTTLDSRTDQVGKDQSEPIDHFTSDLVKPLEASKSKEEVISEKFDESQLSQEKPVEETVTAAHLSGPLESQSAKDSIRDSEKLTTDSNFDALPAQTESNQFDNKVRQAPNEKTRELMDEPEDTQQQSSIDTVSDSRAEQMSKDQSESTERKEDFYNKLDKNELPNHQTEKEKEEKSDVDKQEIAPPQLEQPISQRSEPEVHEQQSVQSIIAEVETQLRSDDNKQDREVEGFEWPASPPLKNEYNETAFSESKERDSEKAEKPQARPGLNVAAPVTASSDIVMTITPPTQIESTQIKDASSNQQQSTDSGLTFVNYTEEMSDNEESEKLWDAKKQTTEVDDYKIEDKMNAPISLPQSAISESDNEDLPKDTAIESGYDKKVTIAQTKDKPQEIIESEPESNQSVQSLYSDIEATYRPEERKVGFAQEDLHSSTPSASLESSNKSEKDQPNSGNIENKEESTARSETKQEGDYDSKDSMKELQEVELDQPRQEMRAETITRSGVPELKPETAAEEEATKAETTKSDDKQPYNNETSPTIIEPKFQARQVSEIKTEAAPRQSDVKASDEADSLKTEIKLQPITDIERVGKSRSSASSDSESDSESGPPSKPRAHSSSESNQGKLFDDEPATSATSLESSPDSKFDQSETRQNIEKHDELVKGDDEPFSVDYSITSRDSIYKVSDAEQSIEKEQLDKQQTFAEHQSTNADEFYKSWAPEAIAKAKNSFVSTNESQIDSHDKPKVDKEEKLTQSKIIEPNYFQPSTVPEETSESTQKDLKSDFDKAESSKSHVSSSDSSDSETENDNLNVKDQKRQSVPAIKDEDKVYEPEKSDKEQQTSNFSKSLEPEASTKDISESKSEQTITKESFQLEKGLQNVFENKPNVENKIEVDEKIERVAIAPNYSQPLTGSEETSVQKESKTDLDKTELSKSRVSSSDSSSDSGPEIDTQLVREPKRQSIPAAKEDDKVDDNKTGSQPIKPLSMEPSKVDMTSLLGSSGTADVASTEDKKEEESKATAKDSDVAEKVANAEIALSSLKQIMDRHDSSVMGLESKISDFDQTGNKVSVEKSDQKLTQDSSDRQSYQSDSESDHESKQLRKESKEAVETPIKSTEGSISSAAPPSFCGTDTLNRFSETTKKPTETPESDDDSDYEHHYEGLVEVQKVPRHEPLQAEFVMLESTKTTPTPDLAFSEKSDDDEHFIRRKRSTDLMQKENDDSEEEPIQQATKSELLLTQPRKSVEAPQVETRAKPMMSGEVESDSEQSEISADEVRQFESQFDEPMPHDEMVSIEHRKQSTPFNIIKEQPKDEHVESKVDSDAFKGDNQKQEIEIAEDREELLPEQPQTPRASPNEFREQPFFKENHSQRTPEPYEVATAVIGLVHDNWQGVRLAEQYSAKSEVDAKQKSTVTKEDEQKESSIVENIKSDPIVQQTEPISLEFERKDSGLAKPDSADSSREMEDLVDQILKENNNYNKSDSSEPSALKQDGRNPEMDKPLDQLKESQTDETFGSWKDTEVRDADANWDLNSTGRQQQQHADDFVRFDSSERIAQPQAPAQEYAIRDFDDEDYHARFDTGVPVEKVATVYKADDPKAVERKQSTTSLSSVGSEDKYRPLETDLDLKEDDKAQYKEINWGQYDVKPRASETVSVVKHSAALESAALQPFETFGSGREAQQSDIEWPQEPLGKYELPSGTEKTDEKVKDSKSNQDTSGSDSGDDWDFEQEAEPKVVKPKVTDSGVDMFSFSSRKESNVANEPIRVQSGIPIGLLSESNQEMIDSNLINRYQTEAKDVAPNVSEVNTLIERDLVEHTTTIERRESQSIEIEDKPANAGIMQTSATATVTEPIVPLTTALTTSTTMTESISTSSSSFYVEPAIATSMLRSADNTADYLSRMSEDASTASSTSIESSESDGDNLFQFNTKTGAITTTPTSPIPTNVQPMATTPRADTFSSSSDSTFVSTTVTTPVMSSSASNGTAGNRAPQPPPPPSSQSFDVDREWGRPLSLPPPQPPGAVTSPTGNNTNSSAKHLPPLQPRSRSKERTAPKSERQFNHHSGVGSQYKCRVHPVYVELAYVPGHGKRGYCDELFFRQVRARYYVFSGVTPSRAVFDALLAGKATWEENLYVTLIPTYESEALCAWIRDNQQRISELRIDVAPAANRCTLRLADEPTGAGNPEQESCSAYKVEL